MSVKICAVYDVECTKNNWIDIKPFWTVFPWNQATSKSENILKCVGLATIDDFL